MNKVMERLRKYYRELMQGSNKYPGRQDDELLVDAEWMVGVGFKNRTVHDMGDDMFKLPIRNINWSIEWGRNSRVLYIECGYSFGIGFTVMKNPTRRDVKKLIQVLCIDCSSPQ